VPRRREWRSDATIGRLVEPTEATDGGPQEIGMTPSTQQRILLRLVAAVSVVGIIDGIVGGDVDVVLMFSLTLLGWIVVVLRISWHRPAVPIRADLVRWMESRAVEGGESIDAVADRAIAAYRQGLTAPTTDE
jgi:hypothetical protein